MTDGPTNQPTDYDLKPGLNWSWELQRDFVTYLNFSDLLTSWTSWILRFLDFLRLFDFLDLLEFSDVSDFLTSQTFWLLRPLRWLRLVRLLDFLILNNFLSSLTSWLEFFYFLTFIASNLSTFNKMVLMSSCNIRQIESSQYAISSRSNRPNSRKWPKKLFWLFGSFKNVF